MIEVKATNGMNFVVAGEDAKEPFDSLLRYQLRHGGNIQVSHNEEWHGWYLQANHVLMWRDTEEETSL